MPCGDFSVRVERYFLLLVRCWLVLHRGRYDADPLQVGNDLHTRNPVRHCIMAAESDPAVTRVGSHVQQGRHVVALHKCELSSTVPRRPAWLLGSNGV